MANYNAQQYYNELRSYVDEVIDFYGIKDESDLRDIPYHEVTMGFAAIKLKYEDTDLECIYESNDFDDVRDLLCKNLRDNNLETSEDFQDKLNRVICDYYKPDLEDWLKDRLSALYQEEMIETGYDLMMDRENGEFRWVKGARYAAR